MQSAADSAAPRIGITFTLLFVTLRPIKLLGPFAQATRDVDDRVLKRIALLSFVVARSLLLLVASSASHCLRRGRSRCSRSHSRAASFFSWSACVWCWSPTRHTIHPSPTLPAKPLTAAFQLAFPLVVTPYGIAAIIALLANNAEPTRTAEILEMVVAVMLMNLLSIL